MGLNGPALSVRLDGNPMSAQVAGQFVVSGRIDGPITFLDAAKPDITCASGRWSMGQTPQ